LLLYKKVAPTDFGRRNADAAAQLAIADRIVNGNGCGKSFLLRMARAPGMDQYWRFWEAIRIS